MNLRENDEVFLCRMLTFWPMADEKDDEKLKSTAEQIVCAIQDAVSTIHDVQVITAPSCEKCNRQQP